MLTPELLADLADPQELALSPDGEWLLYVLRPNSKRSEHAESAIWRVRTDGSGEAQALTQGLARDRHPRWSPDGSQIAFLSDRVPPGSERGVFQIYVMPTHGGEARALTHGKRSVAAFAWSPDGIQIAMLSADEPTPEETRRKLERDDAVAYGAHWQPQRLRVLELASGNLRPLMSADGHIIELAWSPDGRRIAFLQQPVPDLREGDAMRCMLVELEAQRVQQICAGWRMDSLTWDKGGNAITLRDTVGRHAQASHAFYAVDLITRVRTHLMGGVETCALPGPLQANAAHGLLLCEADGLATHVHWRTDLTSVTQRVLSSAGADGIVEFAEVTAMQSASGLQLAWVQGREDAGAEVFAQRSGVRRQLTHTKRALKDSVFGCIEPFYWHAPDGLSLDGVLVKPVNAGDGPWPTLVLVHGGPYHRIVPGFFGSWARWGQMLAQHGIAVLMPNYRGGQGHGEAFAALARGGVGSNDFQDIESATDAAIARGITRGDRVGIGGWSQGGFMTAWAVTQTQRYRCGIMGAGVSDWGTLLDNDMPVFERELGGSAPWEGLHANGHAQPHVLNSPLTFARNARTPLLILHGERDARVPLNQARLFHRALMETGCESEFVTYPREPHGIEERLHQIDVMRRVSAWCVRWLL